MAASERVTYRGASAEQSVTLEEDYFQDVTYTETIPVTRTVCQDVPVTQNICEYVPKTSLWQLSCLLPWSLCANVPSCVWLSCFACRSSLSSVTVVSRQCGNQTHYERITRTERRFQYRSVAQTSLRFDSIPGGYEEISFDVILEDDQLRFSSFSPEAPIMVAKLISEQRRGRGSYAREFQISFIERTDYYAPVSEIPELVDSYRGNLKWRLNEEAQAANLDVSFRIKHDRTGHELSLPVRSPNFYSRGMLSISLSREIGQYWHLWEGRVLWIELTIQRKVNGTVINEEIGNSNQVVERFYL